MFGDVVDANGRGIPGADIWLSERWLTSSGYVVAQADTQGHFRVEGVGADYSLGARAPNHAPSRLRSLRGVANGELRIQLVLREPGAELRGLVVASDGAPVPGAFVLVGNQDVDLGKRHSTGVPPQRGTTDDQGRFAMRSVPLGKVPVQARGIGFAPIALEIEVYRGARNDVRLVLPREARVVGRVLDSQGRPASGVRIRTSTERFAVSSTLSAADGSFILRGLAAGTQAVEAEGEAGNAQAEFVLAEGESATWNVVLADVPWIHGLVLDEGGEPLESWVVVAFSGASRERARSAPTDSQGRFAIVVETDQPYDLRVQRPAAWREFPSQLLRNVRPSPEEVVIHVPDPESSAGTLVGRVLGPDGAPAQDCKVNVWHVEERLWRSYLVGSEDGTFEIQHVPPGTLEVELRPERSPWLHLGEHAVEVGRTTDLGTVQLEEAGWIVGTIAGIPDAALPSARFLLTRVGREAGVLQREGVRFRSSALAEGTYVLKASADHAVSQRHEIELELGRERVLDIEFVRAGLRRVVFELPPEARAPKSMWCSVSDTGGNTVWSRGALRPDADGRLVALVSVPPGEFKLAAETNNGLRAEARLVVSAMDGSDPELRVVLQGE